MNTKKEDYARKEWQEKNDEYLKHIPECRVDRYQL